MGRVESVAFLASGLRGYVSYPSIVCKVVLHGHVSGGRSRSNRSEHVLQFDTIERAPKTIASVAAQL